MKICVEVVVEIQVKLFCEIEQYKLLKGVIFESIEKGILVMDLMLYVVLNEVYMGYIYGYFDSFLGYLYLVMFV